jgi:hypothetical protein
MSSIARATSAIVGYRRRAASSESTARRGGDAPTVVAGGTGKCPLYEDGCRGFALAAIKAQATFDEIADTLRTVFGEYDVSYGRA